MTIETNLPDMGERGYYVSVSNLFGKIVGFSFNGKEFDIDDEFAEHEARFEVKNKMTGDTVQTGVAFVP